MEYKQNIPGQNFKSVGCLHSFLGSVFYIVLTLEGYFVVMGSVVGKKNLRFLGTFPQSAEMFETPGRIRGWMLI